MLHSNLFIQGNMTWNVMVYTFCIQTLRSKHQGHVSSVLQKLSHNILLKKPLLSSVHTLQLSSLKSYITFDLKSRFREVDQ